MLLKIKTHFQRLCGELKSLLISGSLITYDHTDIFIYFQFSALAKSFQKMDCHSLRCPQLENCLQIPFSFSVSYPCYRMITFRVRGELHITMPLEAHIIRSMEGNVHHLKMLVILQAGRNHQYLPLPRDIHNLIKVIPGQV